MKKLNKKAFTIVELVIVIAVIAILAAVLIPTFANLIRKGRVSTDSQLIRNLNTALSESRVNAEHSTMTDALDAAAEYGFDVAKINAKAKNNEILWDSVNDVFCYLNDGRIEYLPDSVKEGKKLEATDYRLWKIYNAAPKADDTYSIYVASQAAADYVAANDVAVGVDCGNFANDVSYKNAGAAQSVVIRTNGGNLTVDAPGDVVNHYGDAEVVNIIAVASASYHEFGGVAFADIAKGRIVLEAKSEVNHIHVTAKENGQEFDEVIIATTDVTALPTLSRDDVEIADGGTLVVALEYSSNTDYVWLTKQGIYEQIKVSDNKESAGTVWVDDSSNSASTQEAAKQIANNIGRDESGKVAATVTIAEDEYSITLDEDRNIVVKDASDAVVTAQDVVNAATAGAVEVVADKESQQIGATQFAGGTGSESDPFLIVDYDTFQNVGTFYDKGYYFFKVKDGVSTLDLRNWVPVNMNGSFEGNNVSIINLDKPLFADVKGDKVSISNMDIVANIAVSGGVSAVVGDDCNSLTLVIDNVDVHGTIVGASWVVSYVVFGPGPAYAWNLTIKNSISDATLVATSGSASGFVGHPYDDVSNGSLNGLSLINIVDSAYVGNMTATGSVTGTNFKYFTINGNNNRVRTSYSDAFVAELGYDPEGTLYATPATGYDNKGKANEVVYEVVVNEDGSKTFLCGNYGKNMVDNYKPAAKKAVLNTTAQATLPANVGDTFTVKKVSGAVKAVASLQIAPNDKNNYGSYLGTYLTEEIDISGVATGATFNTEQVKYFTINVNSGVTKKTGVSGNIFNVVNDYYGKNAHNGATVQVVQFDANGNVLNITSIKIASAHAAE